MHDKIKKILTIFFIVFFICIKNAQAEIRPENVKCNNNSDCNTGCCIVNIFDSNNSNLLQWVRCRASGNTNCGSMPQTSGNGNNACWPSEACESTSIVNYFQKAVAINGECGSITSYSDGVTISNFNNASATEKCSSGNYTDYSIGDGYVNWTCAGNYGGRSTGCGIKIVTAVSEKQNGVCKKMDGEITSLPKNNEGCIVGTQTKAIINKDGNEVTWSCTGIKGGSSTSCSADYRDITMPAEVKESDPFKAVENIVSDKTTNKTQDQTQNTPVKSNLNFSEQPDNTGTQEYELLNKFAQSCQILYDPNCEVIDTSFLSAITAKKTIQEAMDVKQLNPDFPVAPFTYEAPSSLPFNYNSDDAVFNSIPCNDSGYKYIDGGEIKENGNRDSAYTLTNIQKLRKARILPTGFELAAMCITGQTQCANGYQYDVKCNGDICWSIIDGSLYKESTPGSGVYLQVKCEKRGGVIQLCEGDSCIKHKIYEDKNVKLKDVVAGYTDCNSDTTSIVDGSFNSKNGKYCHLVNKDWVLRNPKYRCESGETYSYLLYATSSSSVNNRYQICNDVSSCLKEKDNGQCEEYGYCLREKNIWKFTGAAQSCSVNNVGCKKYTYTVDKSNSAQTTLGFIDDTLDYSVCDASNSGCRRYSTATVADGSSQWRTADEYKIYLNDNAASCSSSDVGCTAFIRRDTANLIKNSSFENYSVSKSNNIKINSWSFAGSNSGVSYSITTKADNGIVVDGDSAIKLSVDSNKIGIVHFDNKNLIEVQPAKTYILSYYVRGNVDFNGMNIDCVQVNSTTCDKAMSATSLGYGAFVNVKEFNSSKGRIKSTDNEVIDIDNIKYVNSSINNNTYIRKSFKFKTSEDTKYIDVLLIFNNKNNNQREAYFDAIQLQEGGTLNNFSTYENSEKIYLKKAPDTSSCYSNNNANDIYCDNFIKKCEEKDVGCRGYREILTSNNSVSEIYIPAKPKETDYCPSECRGYSRFLESGPSYDPKNGTSFQQFIANNTKSCTVAGCSEYQKVKVGGVENEYYSSINTCIKETNDIGICTQGTYQGAYCNKNDDCGTNGVCDLSNNEIQYNDYFTYSGSENSGYRLNVYRLLRRKICSNAINSAEEAKSCNSDSDCGPSASCIYNDNDINGANAPALIRETSFNVCNYNIYSRPDHTIKYPDCREFHGPKKHSSNSSNNGSDDDYILYYANMSEVIPVSNEKCEYYTIKTFGNEVITKDDCDKISYLPAGIRYNSISNACNIGIDKSSSVTCSSSELHCREYIGTGSMASRETKFITSFEIDVDTQEWKKTNNSSVTGDIVNESIFQGDHSLRIDSNGIVFTEVDYQDDETNATYLISAYIKNSSASGDSSKVCFYTGAVDKNCEQENSASNISNEWKNVVRSMSFSYKDLAESNGRIYFKNLSDSLVVYVDNIVLEKSTSIRAIKQETWNVPVSCDNKLDNSEGICTEEESGEDGVCVRDPNDSSKNKGYRLYPGFMVGCKYYIDSYNNYGYYKFNDLSLCDSSSVGCEALYDTKNSSSSEKQIYNSKTDYSGMISQVSFDNEDRIGFDDYNFDEYTPVSGSQITYSGLGKLSGAASFSNGYLQKQSTSTGASSAVTFSAWIYPNASLNDVTIISAESETNIAQTSNNDKKAFYRMSISGSTIKCSVGGGMLYTSYTLSDAINNWHYALCSFDGSKIYLYIDGKKVADYNSANLAVMLNTTSNSNIKTKIGEGFRGYIDEVRIYSKMFTAQDVYNAYADFSDDYVVPADTLGYYVIDDNYRCSANVKGCTTIGKGEDKYNSTGKYTTAYRIVDPDKFVSYAGSGNIISGSMCTVEEEGCYKFKDENNTTKYFKFPKELCIYKENVNVGNDSNGKNILKDGWFKYDKNTKTVSNEGCYYNEIKKIKYSNENDNSKIINDNEVYNIVKSSECEYREEPVVVRRTIERVCSNNSTITCTTNAVCNGGTCDRYITYPLQNTYYIYNGTCEGTNQECDSDSSCSSGKKCNLIRTNETCNPNDNSVNCFAYGYTEKPGVIDEFTNTVINFNVYQEDSTGQKRGEYCSGGSNCGSPWTVTGWFKKDSTRGCSDDGDDKIEPGDYMNIYNGSVGICNEYNCTNFIEPTEKSCVYGNLHGYSCQDDTQCGSNNKCVTDENTGKRYCVYKNNQNNTIDVDENINSTAHCVFDEDCGFGGVCRGNNTYSYIYNDAIKNMGSSCNGQVSRESGCILFNNTAISTLSFASQATYNKVKSNGNGKAVTPVTGDNSKGVNQLDSNMILKVSRDRECSEWLTFESNIGYVSTSKDFSLNNNNSNIKTCTSLNEDKTCNTEYGIGSGYEEKLDVRKYISDMKGEWANNDYSGFAIPMLESVEKAGWASRQIVAGSTSIFTGNEKYAERQICKSYPEQDSPFNFSDKYNVQLYKCNCNGKTVGETCTSITERPSYSLVEVNRNESLWSGNDWCVKGDNNSYSVVLSDYNSKKVIAFSYEQFQNFSTNDYLRTVLSGVSLPYYTSDSPAFDTNGNLYNLIWVDDSQECYYKKVQYENVNTPAYHYFGSDKNIQSKVCYSKDNSKVVVNDCDADNFIEGGYTRIKTTTEGRVDTSNSKIFGNCIEYSYSSEIYYPGSGKYNCITWIPGYISK